MEANLENLAPLIIANIMGVMRVNACDHSQHPPGFAVNSECSVVELLVDAALEL
ncbi:MAG: hypothetical protein WB930_14325 [Syntrophobacteraceae bacterium]